MAQSPDDPSQLLPSTRRALLHRVATGQADGRLPSLVAAVVRDRAPVWFAARGTANGAEPTAQTQYRIGSVTKVFVAIAVMRLRDEGRLRLSDPLDDHLPGTTAGALRIGELLAHTAGLEAESPGLWWERTAGDLRPELSDVLGADPVRHPAGRRFHYSNVGFAMLGALVARLRGKPWDEVVRAEILDPLGLSRTSVTRTGRNGYHAGETLRPVTRSDGTVSHLDIGTFVFTRQPYDGSAPVPGGVDPEGWRPA
jgi:D-alanyl-D-alanine carboxypeptidase